MSRYRLLCKDRRTWIKEQEETWDLTHIYWNNRLKIQMWQLFLSHGIQWKDDSSHACLMDNILSYLLHLTFRQPNNCTDERVFISNAIQQSLVAISTACVPAAWSIWMPRTVSSAVVQTPRPLPHSVAPYPLRPATWRRALPDISGCISWVQQACYIGQWVHTFYNILCSTCKNT